MDTLIPGEIVPAAGDIEINAGRARLRLEVANTGDRPIQVGSHFHFAETNDALAFDRAAARGFRLDIPAGTAVRFEPGQRRTVDLVALGGDRIVIGFQGRVLELVPLAGLEDAPNLAGDGMRIAVPVTCAGKPGDSGWDYSGFRAVFTRKSCHQRHHHRPLPMRRRRNRQTVLRRHHSR